MKKVVSLPGKIWTGRRTKSRKHLLAMQRRCVDNDYTARRMYMVTMVTEGRKALFGKVAGRSEAVEPSAEASHTSLAMGQDANRIIARSDKTRGYPSIIYIKV